MKDFMEVPCFSCIGVARVQWMIGAAPDVAPIFFLP